MPQVARRCVPVSPSAPMLRALLQEHAGSDAEITLALQAWADALEWLRLHEPVLPAPRGWQWVPLQLPQGAVSALLLQPSEGTAPQADVQWAHRAWARVLPLAPLPPLDVR